MMRSWGSVLLSLGLACLAETAMADAFKDAQSAALVWIEAQPSPDGSWGSDARLRPLLTHQAIESLSAAGRRRSSYYGGLTWMENHATPGVDGHARRILALAPHGDDLSRSLSVMDAAALEVAPGETGWGLSAGYRPSVLDTALALEAYAAAAALGQADAGIVYLLARQAPSGGWPFRAGLPEDPVTTAIVLRVLVGYAGLTPIDLSASRALARGYLGASVSAASPRLARAHAALALLRDTPGSAAATTLLTSLLSEQDPVDGDENDGSWGGDVLVTAVASRALSALAGSDDPTLASVVDVPDFALRSTFNQALARNVGDQVTRGDLTQLETLDAASAGLMDLTGLEAATALTWLETVLLYGNPGLGTPCDVNASGTLDAGDATRIITLVGSESSTYTDQAVADVAPSSGPGDGRLDVADVLLVISAAGGRPVATCPGS